MGRRRSTYRSSTINTVRESIGSKESQKRDETEMRMDTDDGKSDKSHKSKEESAPREKPEKKKRSEKREDASWWRAAKASAKANEATFTIGNAMAADDERPLEMDGIYDFETFAEHND